MMERITQSMLATTTVYNVQANLNRMAEINESMTSGKRMKFASDDPASSVDSMRLRKHLSATEQYQRNIDDASSWLQTANSAMDTVSARYMQAKDSLIRANSGAQGKESLGAIAADLRQQATSLMNSANTTYLGRTVFAGNSDKGAAFSTRVTAAGKRVFEQTEQDAVTKQEVSRQINANQVVKANVDGNKLFGTGSINWTATVQEGDKGQAVIKHGGEYYREVKRSDGTVEAYQKFDTAKASWEPQTSTASSPTTAEVAASAQDTSNQVKIDIDYKIDDTNNPNVMNLLVAAAEMLEEGGVDQSKMTAIQGQLEKRFELVQTELSSLGARHKVVLENQESVVTDLNNIKSQISGVEDIDIQKSTIELSLADMAYKASLGATQRVVQPTLLDYLR